MRYSKMTDQQLLTYIEQLKTTYDLSSKAHGGQSNYAPTRQIMNSINEAEKVAIRRGLICN